MKKGYHKTKDGRTAKKGLYYYMNKRKKAGTSRKSYQYHKNVKRILKRILKN